MHDVRLSWIGAKPNISCTKMYLFQHEINENNAYPSLNTIAKEEYARKRIYNGCLVRIENSVTLDNCSVSQGFPCDGIFNPHLTTVEDSYNPDP